jgi:PAS domain S-box-containing protein
LLEGAVEHAIIEMDLDRAILGWNPGAERLFGWMADEVLGQSADVIFPSEDIAAGAPQLEARRALNERPAQDTRYYVRKDGARFWATGVLSPLRDRDGQPDGLLKIVRDQSAVRASEETLIRALDAATESSEARSRLLAVAGHDLRQPLQVVSMVLDRLGPKLTDKKDRRYLEHARDALGRLTGDLERLAQASAADSAIRPSLMDFPIREVLARIASTWRHHAEAKGLALRVMSCRYNVRSDPAMLTTIIGNFVGNAIKYTDKGGVVVGCRRRSKDRLAIEVVDTGVGIDPAVQQYLFDDRFRIDTSIEGLGLGLPIVRRTAAVLGHALSVASAPGRGSRFSVEVPLV